MPEQNILYIPLLLVAITIIMMATTIICNWTDDERSASAPLREPIPDEITTDRKKQGKEG